MAQHACPRCGLETSCPHGGWPDRHPAAAVTAGLFGLTLMCMMLSVHPVAALTMLTVAGLAGAAYRIDREHLRRQALAARADYENHADHRCAGAAGTTDARTPDALTALADGEVASHGAASDR
jgi:hypothetical protein